MQQRSRILGTITVLTCLATTGLPWQAPAAAAATGCRTDSSDFDADGTPDVAVGIPGQSGKPGAVEVRLSNKGKPFTTTVHGPHGFGTAITSLSSYEGPGDEALCSQLVVGSPEESLDPALKRSGAIHVFYWDSANKGFVFRSIFGQPGEDGSQSGARFGAALAAEPRRAGQVTSRPGRLWVGSPGQDLWAGPDSGQVTSFWIDADQDTDIHDPRLTTLGEPWTDDPTPRANLGASLSVGGGMVAMGMPGFPDQGKANAGAVLVEQAKPDPDAGDLFLDQTTRGVPGTSEKGDRFGASVHLVAGPTGSAPTLLVGTPGEDVGRKTDAGAVTVLRISPKTYEPIGTVRTVNQDSAGMAGTAERGDQFGTSVSSIRAGGKTRFLVGVPGEDVGRAKNAGMVQAIGTGKGWTQNSKRIPGHAETGDRMGASLGGSVDTGATRPLIGVPGENSNTGGVLIGLPVDGHRPTFLVGKRAGARYGFSVSP
ncbi:MAG: hypothetical protein QM650_09985 [Microlunatus sp.]